MGYEPTIWQDGDTITSVRLNKLEQGAATMGYEPTIWQDGDTITSVRLNKLEQGVATLSENSGVSLGPLIGILAGGAKENEEITIYVSTTPYDITSGETYSDVLNPIYNSTNVLSTRGNDVSISAPSGCYVVIEATVPTGWTTDSLAIHDAGYSQQITSGFECRVFSDDYYTNVLFTMQVPANGLTVDFGNGVNVGE